MDVDLFHLRFELANFAKSLTGSVQNNLLAEGVAEAKVFPCDAADDPALSLPFIHRDPFDRLLIAQSLAEPLTLLTNDAVLDRYRIGARIV